ncbi:MAG: inositol monophosphatase family protein [Pseudomonadota bacterium]
MDKQKTIETALTLADCAKEISLRYFRNPDLTIENKDQSDFDPVTQADREIELKIRECLSGIAPQDGILGEEFDPMDTQSGLTWVIDPIDGTRAFMAGQPTWGTLIALHDGQKPIFGLVDQPYIGERFMGGWGSAILSRCGTSTLIQTRKSSGLSGAILYTTFPEIGTSTERAAFERVATQVQLVRYGMDCYAYAMLAAGLIDVVIEAGLSPYDIYAPAALIDAAGGQVTNWQGDPLDKSGQALAIADKDLADDIIALLNAT